MCSACIIHTEIALNVRYIERVKENYRRRDGQTFSFHTSDLYDDHTATAADDDDIA